MADPIATTIAVAERTDQARPEATDDVVVEDVLVEEVSIDGMCGVY